MSPHLARYIDAFAGLHVLVIGEAMLDSYLEGTTGRLCREAPVPIVALTARRDAPGGGANTAANARALGARVSFLSVAGEDPEGALLRRALADRGVATDGLLADPSRRTLAKNRVVASSQLLVRFDQGSTGPVSGGFETVLIERLEVLFPACEAVIVQAPAASGVTVDPLNVQTEVVVEAKLTGTPDALSSHMLKYAEAEADYQRALVK